jgi:hypothetical protein
MLIEDLHHRHSVGGGRDFGSDLPRPAAALGVDTLDAHD